MDANSNPINIADTIQNVNLTNVDTLEEYYPTTGLNNIISFDNIPTQVTYKFNGTCPGYIIPANGWSDMVWVSYESDNQTFPIIIQSEE